MGREIYSQIRLPGQDVENPLWDSAAGDLDDFVCGRDDATDFITMRGGEDGELDITDPKERESILSVLDEYLESDKREIDKAKNYLRDLNAARRNARNFKDFSSFSDVIEATEDWIREHDWSRAKALKDLIENTVSEFKKHRIKYLKAKMYLVISE